MALNFGIVSHRSNDSIHLELNGDFDGSSAFELIIVLKSHSGKFRKIIIHTCDLASIHPFGLGVFQKNFSINKLSGSLMFTGRYGNTMAWK